MARDTDRRLPRPRGFLRGGLRTKLNLAFAIVLVPVLVVLFLSFRESHARGEESTLRAQLLTAQAFALQVDEIIDAAVAIGWAVANDPLSQTMDPKVLDPHLRALAHSHPLYETVTLFDAQGHNQGWGHTSEPAEPRLYVGDREFFKEAMRNNAPAISGVLMLRRPLKIGFLAATPIRGPDHKPIGVVDVVTYTDVLARSYRAMMRAPKQHFLLADPKGRLAFHTARAELTWDESGALAELAPLKTALAGRPVMVPSYTTAFSDDERIGAFVPTPKHGWAVGVSMPRDVALEPVDQAFRLQLLAFAIIAVMSAIVGSFLVRRLVVPVQRLEDHSRALAQGDWSHRVDIRTADELEQLGTSFNQLAQRLSEREAELRNVQGELARRERLVALGELAAAVAHEVRNPLAVIFNSVNCIRRDPAGPDGRRLLDIVEEESDRLNRIVGDLLDFARPRLPAVQPEPLRKVLDEAMASAFAGMQGLSLEVEFDPKLPEVPMDQRLLRQALINLATNAGQASRLPATVRVRVRREQRDGKEVAHIEVSDEGPGIPPEIRERIFEPFFTTKAQGTGLGLAVVKRIVEDHQGSIEVSSTELGTTFIVRLPLEVPPAGPAAPG